MERARFWTFTDSAGSIPDFVNHQKNLIDVYRLANPNYKDDETTPVLWDKKNRMVVSNESADIIRMFATEFKDISKFKLNLYPEALRSSIDSVMKSIYPSINNGVYRAGFATSQRAYERAFKELFSSLDYWEKELGEKRYLCGSQLTLADICMFTTLFRFDLVYYGHFKCNRRHLYEYKNLWGYVRDIFQTPGVSETCNIEHIKKHYYSCQTSINPNKIVPLGPALDFMKLHTRSEL